MKSSGFMRAVKDGSLTDLMDSAFAASDDEQKLSTSAVEAEELRFAMTLRGRCDPAWLLSLLGIDRSLWGQVLDQVAADCDAGAGAEHGLWLLSDEARRAQLRSRPADKLVDALRMVIEPDEITKALSRVFGQPFELDGLSSDELRALIMIEPAIAGLRTSMPIGAEIRRHLSVRTRIEEFDRFVAEGFVGRDLELQKLLDFTQSDHRKLKAASALVWGTGGIGKSTLIAALLSRLMHERDPRIVPVHLDFDRSDLTPVDTLTLTLELLRQVGTIDKEMDHDLKGKRDELREFLNRRLSSPSFGSREKSSQDGMILLRDSLRRLKIERRVLVIVLDTFENVENDGDATLRGLRRWIDRLISLAGAYAVRLVVAGRSNPSRRHLDKLLSWRKPLVLHLDELARADACGMMTSGGLPIAVAESLYKVLGGNPLVLSLVRKLFKLEDGAEELQAIADDVKSNLIPQKMIQGVLYDRFLKHLKSDDARSYAHPGLVLPELTPALIRNVLGPLKGESRMKPDRAQKIFDELAAAAWLVHVERGALVQRPDVRRLMIKLMSADNERGAEVKRVRLAALMYHAKRSTAADRAAMAYHLLMRVDATEDLALLDGHNFSGTGTFLRRHLEDYPDIARTFVEVLDFEGGRKTGRRSVVRNVISAEQALNELPDDLWESFIVGDEGRSGEGDRIAETGDPSVALDLWRRRPAGYPGRPPTFVVRSLAESAEWNTGEVDLHAMIHELEGAKEIRASGIERRIYWVTAFALMAHPAGFTGAKPVFAPLIRTLKKVHAGESRSIALDDLVSLTAMVEGLSETEILPRSTFSSASPFASVTRLHLQRGRWGSRLLEWTVNVGSMVTLQRDFADRIGRVDQDVIRIGSQTVFRSQSQEPTREALKNVQQSIDELDGLGREEFLKLSFWKLRATVRAGKHGSSNTALQALLLRGQTPELHRPARAALLEGLGVNEANRRDRGYALRVRSYIESIQELFSVKPREFMSSWFTSQVSHDPKGAFLSLVEFADRARVLAAILDEAVAFAVEPEKILRVASTLRSWDCALAGDEECSWRPRQATDAKTGKSATLPNE